MEEMSEKKEQIRKLMEEAWKEGKTVDWAKVVLCQAWERSIVGNGLCMLPIIDSS